MAQSIHCESYVQAIADKEAEAIESFRSYLRENAELLAYVAAQGDGEGGMLVAALKEELFGARADVLAASARSKQPIRQSVRVAVFERDMYRCLRCGTHKNLRADHVIPESKGGPTAIENLQTLCGPCNSWKGVRTADFRKEALS